MTRRGTTLATALALALALAPDAWAGRATAPATIRLKAFLTAPAAARLARLAADVEKIKADQQSRTEGQTLLREAFLARWVEGRDSPLELGQFDELANGVGDVFGASDAQLVDLVAAGLPSAWRERAFLQWLRKKWPAAPAGDAAVERFVARAVALADLPDAAARLAFVLEVGPEAAAARVRSALDAVVDGCPLPLMGALHERLVQLSGMEQLTRWKRDGLTARASARLGDRLFAATPRDWAAVTSALLPLVRASSHGEAEWVRRAAQAARDGDRSAETAGVVRILCASMSPAGAAHAALAPATEVASFAWYHTTGVLAPLHGRDPALRSTDYDALKRFVTQGHGAALFAVTRDVYYRDTRFTEPVFAELVRRWAKGTGVPFTQADPLRAAVYDAALNDGWIATHRGLLALDLLAGPPGTGLDPAYAGGLSKLAIATALFVGQASSTASVAALDTQLASPLADALVGEALALLRQSDAAAKEAVNVLASFARAVSAWRARGAHTVKSAPLKRLHDALTVRVLEALDRLPRTPAELSTEARAGIDSFVSALVFAFRLAPLVEAVRGERADWFGTAVDGLAQRVFGIPAAGFADATYWPADRVRFLAGLLSELDPPLRGCLDQMGTADQRARLFRALYLPLVRVHGFVKTLREASKRDVWPHLAWARKEIAAARLEALFDALATRRWLDADDAVVELTRERLDAVLRTSVWRTSPARLWSGRSSANFHAGVLAQLFDEPVPPETDLELGALADFLTGRLETGPAVTGPRFPAATPGERDATEAPWKLAPLALNLVTAAEWKEHPFIGTDGRAMSWRAFVTTGAGGLPFRFHLTAIAVRRTVDGRRRARLVRLLDPVLEPASPEERADRLDLLARAVQLLPNAPDNLAGAASELEAYRAQKAWVYQRLATAMGANATVPAARRPDLVRAAMLVDASVRSGAALVPPLEQVFTAFASVASDAERSMVDDLRAERAELASLSGGPPRDMNAWHRAAIDAGLAAFGKPVACLPDASLRHRGYKARLGALRPERVLAVLRLRAHLRELLAHSTAGEDLERCGGLLELIDQTCFYARPDFDVEQMGLLARPLPRDGGSGQWRPGLVVLAWCDGALKELIAREAERAVRRGPAGAALATCVEKKLRELNEAVFLTVRGIANGAAGDAAATFADFRPHQLRTSIVDYRVLAEQLVEEEASAESLARDCFDGARMNLAQASARAKPGDAALQERLFGAGRTVSVDALVRFAAACKDSTVLPEPLVKGAAAFFEARYPDLLAGASTAVGAFGALAACAERSARADAPAAYRTWFEDRLIAAKTGLLADDVERALAAPFFRGTEAAQRADMGRLLDRWRSWLALPPAPAGSIARILGQDFGRVLDRLLRGLLAPLGAARLCAPAVRLANETGLRGAPPAEFFALVLWWLSLAKAEEPAPVKALFTVSEREGDEEAHTGVDSLRDAFRMRCDVEIRHLAKDLDARAAGLAQPPPGGLLSWADAAWAQGPQARTQWRALLAAPRRYSTWAREAGLPAAFRVPDTQREHAVAGKRWEGLRALLIPESPAGAPRLGWDEPTKDARAFSDAGGWVLEWLLALRWRDGPPADAHVVDADWAVRESGAAHVAAWLAAPAAPLTLYHGDYVYRPLAPPVMPPELAFRAGVALTRLSSRTAPASAVPRLSGETDPATRDDLLASVRAKDELAAALLARIARTHGGDTVALDWFDAGARFFPYLTAWRPEAHRNNGVSALEPRAANASLAPANLTTGVPLSVAARLRAAVLSAPVARMSADGSCILQVAGHSTDIETPGTLTAARTLSVPEPRAVPGPRPLASPASHIPAPIAPSVSTRRAARAGDTLLAPAGAWRTIGEWVAQETTRALAGIPGTAPAVHYTSGDWCLAFGAEELEQTLHARAPRGARLPARLDVRVVQVDPHAAVTVAVEIDGREIARRTFGIRGPWPPWFAVRTGAAPSRALLFLCFGALFLMWRAVTRARHARDVWDRIAFAMSVCALAGAWLAWPTPRPRATGELAGVVEVWVPSDAAVPERLRALGPLACAHLYRALCRETGEDLAIQGVTAEDPGDFDRWLATTGQLTIPWPLVPARVDAHASTDGGSLGEMHVRLNTYAYERVSAFEGRVAAAGLEPFRRATHSTEFGGEPDLAPAYFDADRGVALTVVLADGEHGALAAVPELAVAAPPVPRAPLVTLAALSPSRDAVAHRELTIDARLAWLERHSSATLVLTPEGELVDAAALAKGSAALAAADRTAGEPQDMDRAREAWWAGLSDAQLADATRRFAERAVVEFRRDRSRTSRTVLESEPHAGRFWLAVLAALLTALAPAWLARVGLTRPSDAAAALAQALAGPALLALALPAFALAAPARTFGLPLEEALRIALWTTVWALTIGTLIGVLFSLAARQSAFSSHVLHAKATWPTRRRITLPALAARACGAFALTVGLAALLAAPVGAPSSFWPEELGTSLIIALLFWQAGATLLWTAEAPRGASPPHGAERGTSERNAGSRAKPWF